MIRLLFSFNLGIRKRTRNNFLVFKETSLLLLCSDEKKLFKIYNKIILSHRR